MTFLVCGDSMEDIYIKGETSRISPEAPVAIVKVLETVSKPGGAANVRMNVQTLGMEARGLYSYSAATNPVQKVRVLGRSQQMLRLDYAHRQAPIAPEAFEPEPWIIFSDYGKGSLDRVQELIRKSPDSKIFIDPRGTDYDRYKGAWYIKPNKDEMKELVGGWANQDELDFKARQFLSVSGIETILLTQASEGLTLYTRGEALHFPAEATEVIDVLGAGETTLSAFAAALAKGHSFAESAKYACKAAGVSVGHFGTTIVEEKDVFS